MRVGRTAGVWGASPVRTGRKEESPGRGWNKGGGGERRHRSMRVEMSLSRSPVRALSSRLALSLLSCALGSSRKDSMRLRASGRCDYIITTLHRPSFLISLITADDKHRLIFHLDREIACDIGG